MIEFDWRAFPSSNFGMIYRPVALVTINGPVQSMISEFLIDSGADITSIPYEAGKYIGLTLKPDDRIMHLGGVGGSIPYILRKIQIIIGTHQFSARIAWTISETMPYLLGQLDVFEQFHIEFRKNELKTILHPF